MPAGIEIEGLTKRYDGALVLRVERLTVEPETTLALIGPSGCGKSTLLRVVIGLVAPDSGTVRIGATPLMRSTRQALLLRMGYVIQEGGLFPHLTAEENVTIVARDQGWDRARILARVEALCELTQIPHTLLARYPTQLSGGQRQRVALMRALMLDPEVLLMDEPLAALDPMIRADLQRELREIFERLRKTVLFVTHDISEAGRVAHELALMRAGSVLQRGALEDLLDRPRDPFVTEFIRAQKPLEALSGARP